MLEVTRTLSILLENDADPNLSNSPNFWTALLLAVLFYQDDMDTEMVEILISYGASDKYSCHPTLSPLYLSLLWKETELAKLILVNEVNANYVTLDNISCSSSLQAAILILLESWLKEEQIL